MMVYRLCMFSLMKSSHNAMVGQPSGLFQPQTCSVFMVQIRNKNESMVEYFPRH